MVRRGRVFDSEKRGFGLVFRCKPIMGWYASF